MEDTTISFRFGHIAFDDISELSKGNRESVKNHFQQWEKAIRHCAAVHSLNQELDFESNKAINVTVNTKKESPTSNG